jgi:heat-inducible transcriptional repressor
MTPDTTTPEPRQPERGQGDDAQTRPPLDERRARVLRAVVEEYVTTAQPVGSQTIATSRELGVSSATVRNDMTVLERDGYLVQPHTSAGRIPTDRGYRFFVDHFARAPGLPPAQRRTVSDFFTSTSRALEDLLHETSQLLANLTHHASVVVGPASDAAVLRNVQLVSLQPGLALVVAVLSNGGVEKEVLQFDDEPDDDQLARAAAAMNASLLGSTLAALPSVGPTGDRTSDRCVAAARGALAAKVQGQLEPLYVSGASRIAMEQGAYATADGAARLLELLEHQVVVVSLVRGLLDHGLTVRIGAENEREDLRDCSLVLAPYVIEGEVAGTVGVLGPTRMDYQQALAAVATVSQQLGRILHT